MIKLLTNGSDILSYNDQILNKPALAVIPEVCPVCGKGTALNLQFTNSGPNGVIYVFRCSHRDCQSIFAYLFDKDTKKVSSLPANNRFEGIPSEVFDVSPTFKEIYFEASSSDQLNYHHLDGMGYRRALEFLVKDYLVYFGIEANTESAYHLSFSSAINKLDNDNLKHLAKASSWLGNDQTHTEIKWNDYTVEDLKSFIKAFSAFILFRINSKKANDLISQRGSTRS